METKFTKMQKMMRWALVLAWVIFSHVTVSSQACACKGNVQVSLDADGIAEVTASMLLADGSTCGGNSLSVSVMTTPTGAPITGSPFVDCSHIGKTLYGKVDNGINSCWTTLTVEDKMNPILTCPTSPLAVTCADFESFLPQVDDNCPGGVTVTQVGVDVETDNGCTGALPSNVLKRITRSYQAEDASGNKSAICSFTFDITVLDPLSSIISSVVGPQQKTLMMDTHLECDGDWARLPNENPSPLNIGNAPGTGVPVIPTANYNDWAGTEYNAGTARRVRDTLVLSGGTDDSQPNTRTLGATFCYTVEANGYISFEWNAEMTGMGGNFANDEPAFSVNGVSTLLATGADGTSAGGSHNIPVLEGDVFCFQVFTMNISNHTVLRVSDLRVPKPLFPATGEHPCGMTARYTDGPAILTGCTTKILRTWTVDEWSCLNRPPWTYIQVLEITDSKAPVVEPLADITASTANHICQGVVTFPNPRAEDNCTPVQNITTDINIYADGDYSNPAGFLRHPQRTATLSVGVHYAEFITRDMCGNENRDTIYITIIDNTPPVAIVNELTTVGLTLDGQAHISAQSFDDGSFDECQLAKTIVRRLDHTNCQPCDIPTFPGFTYLGTHGSGENQRYFYLAAHMSTSYVAGKTALALGGNLVNYNGSSAKRDAVRGFVNGVYPNSSFFMHGVLVDRSTGGAGFPRTADETEVQRYVLEISDICGWSSHAKFCCADINNNPMVAFRAIDAVGNFNDVMVTVIVQDKIGPTITCPDHMTVNCDYIFDRNNLTQDFGWPVATDNCEILTITTDSIINVDNCGRGSITRNFMVTDMGGRTASCSQVITFLPQGDLVYNGPSTHEWPRDTLINGCGNAIQNNPALSPDLLGRPILSNGACSLAGSEYQDQVFSFNQQTSPSCFKILRKWTVIDWCQEGERGRPKEWTRYQEIKVIDNQAPVFDPLDPMVVAETFDNDCSFGTINLTASATDVCTEVLRWRYSIDAFNNGEIDITVLSTDPGQSDGNTIDASGTYPVGVHRIIYTFEDRCGNVTSREQIFSIVNMKQPNGIMLEGLAISLMDMGGGEGMAEIWASDYDPEGKSTHPCDYEVVYSFTEVTLNNMGQMVTTPNMIFDCSQVGQRVPVTVWVAALTPMGDLVQTSVNTFMDVQDNNNVCSQQGGRFVIDGTMTTAQNQLVSDVEVYLQGTEMMYKTDENGAFGFQNILEGFAYNIAPYKNDDPMNGISTLDLVMIQRHILGVEYLKDPYLLIAADINKDEKITASDLTELRRLILGSEDQFTQNNSWRFIDKNYIFTDKENAQGEAFPETYLIDELQGHMTADFIAVKIGDINGNAEVNDFDKTVKARANNTVVLFTENAVFDQGNDIVVPVKISENTDITGMQMTLNFDASMLSLVNITPKGWNVNDANFGFRYLNDGILTFSWNSTQTKALSSGETLFELTFASRDEGKVGDVLSVSSSVTAAEAYNAGDEVMDIVWEVRSGNKVDFALYQNTPNPFQGSTAIDFELPNQMDATLTIHDVTGRVLRTIVVSAQKGLNTVQVDVHNLGTGVMYYTLQAGVHTATRKMVIIE